MTTLLISELSFVLFYFPFEHNNILKNIIFFTNSGRVQRAITHERAFLTYLYPTHFPRNNLLYTPTDRQAQALVP